MRSSVFVMLVFATTLSLGVGCQGARVDDTLNQLNPADVGYPTGPYGYAQGSVIGNLRFVAKLDPAGAMGTANYAAVAMQPISFNQTYHQDSNAQFLVLSGVAGWCAPCNAEQATVPAIQAQYEPRGVRFLEAMIEGYKRGTPATETDLNLWQMRHSLHVGLALDPSDYVHQYADIAAFPLNMVIRTTDMRIVHMQVGQEDLGSVISQFVQ